MWSLSEDFPRISMETVSSALASSRLLSTTSIIWGSGAAAGVGVLVLGAAAISKWPQPTPLKHGSCAFQQSLESGSKPSQERMDVPWVTLVTTSSYAFRFRERKAQPGD